MQIRAATASDALDLRLIHVETWSQTYAGLLPEEFYSERLSAHRARDWTALLDLEQSVGGGLLIARADDIPLGLCEYEPTEDADDDPSRVGHIHRLYVRPGFQLKGIGRELLDQATEIAGRARREVSLWVLENDARAVEFYRRVGWRPDGARRFDGAFDVRYRRQLA